MLVQALTFIKQHMSPNQHFTSFSYISKTWVSATPLFSSKQVPVLQAFCTLLSHTSMTPKNEHYNIIS